MPGDLGPQPNSGDNAVPPTPDRTILSLTTPSALSRASGRCRGWMSASGQISSKPTSGELRLRMAFVLSVTRSPADSTTVALVHTRRRVCAAFRPANSA